MATVVCHYTILESKTALSIIEHAPDARLIYTEFDYDYRNSLAKLWTGEDDLITIEHDIVIDERISLMRNCNHYWCVFGYQAAPHCGRLHRSMGFTKFSAQLQRDFPWEKFDQEKMIWKHLDSVIGHSLSELAPEVHGYVEHLHEYPLAGLGEHDVAWNLLLLEDGTMLPVAKELQADGKTCHLWEIDPETGKNKRFVMVMKTPYEPRYGLEILRWYD